MTVDISAIVVNYNAGIFLRRCVHSLLNCPLAIEVIVVDNASTDESVATVEGLENVRVIRNSNNAGFAAACNIGLGYSSANYLLFLNPDCTFFPGTLIEILKHMCRDEKVGMAGGLLTHPDGTEQAGGRRAVPTPWRSFVRAFGLSRFSDRWPRLFFDFYLHKQPLPQQPIEVEAISGACMLVKREAVNQVGLWDECYFLHCEDLDWCMRFRQKGWRILFVPSAQISHALGACSRSRPFFVEWHKHKGMMRFYHKFFRHQYPGFLMWLVSLGIWIRFGLVVVYHCFRKISSVLGTNR